MSNQPVRVFLVDDSAILRGLLRKLLEETSDIEIVATASNGQNAINKLKEITADVIVLDIEMPVMDGLTALPHLLDIDPTVKVIVASSLSDRSANISLLALEAGATDFLAKPSSSVAGESNSANDFKKDLTEKILTLGKLSQKAKQRSGDKQPEKPSKTAEFSVERVIGFAPKILAIGSSTGGPQALMTLFKNLDASRIHVPVVLTQHMPPTFTRTLAEHITTQTGFPVKEAADGDILEAGKGYLAPGDYHMGFKREDKSQPLTVVLNQGPPVNYCRPAVDVMLDSLLSFYHGSILSVILTGMGHDGLEGCKKVKSNGGVVIAQDKETSVVWGMPAAVHEAGICNATVPIDRVSDAIMEYLI